MGNLLTRLAVAGTLTLGSAALMVAPAQATTDPNAALHINQFDCRGFDGNGVLYTYTNISREVIRSNGDLILKCKFQTTPSPTGKAVTWTFANTGVYCGSEGPERITDITRETVSASGQAMLTCQFKPGIQL